MKFFECLEGASSEVMSLEVPSRVFCKPGFSHILFPSADEGIPEKEEPLEKLELKSSPGKGEDREAKPGEA